MNNPAQQLSLYIAQVKEKFFQHVLASLLPNLEFSELPTLTGGMILVAENEGNFIKATNIELDRFALQLTLKVQDLVTVEQLNKYLTANNHPEWGTEHAE